MDETSNKPKFNPEQTFHRLPRHTVLAANRDKAVTRSEAEDNIVALNSQHELILLIRGMVERVTISEDLDIVLGRADSVKRFYPEVDLTPYGALDRGVSREHARLHLEADNLYITDLGSTNGTFMSGERLEPGTPMPVNRGDELLLGRLAVQIMYR